MRIGTFSIERPGSMNPRDTALLSSPALLSGFREDWEIVTHAKARKKRHTLDVTSRL